MGIGHGVEDGNQFSLGDAFAAEVTALLSSPTAAQVGDKMLSLARAHLSVETCYNPVADLLRSLASPTT